MPEPNRSLMIATVREALGVFDFKTHACDSAALRKALAFAASCIKGGEPWTDTCEKVIGSILSPTPSTELNDD